MLLVSISAHVGGYLGPLVWSFLSSITLAVALMACQIVPVAVTASMYAANALLNLLVVLPQVLTNYRNKATGELSFAVTLMTFGGITTRLFTTMVEVDDLALRLTLVLNWLLAASLLSQFWIYPSPPVGPDLVVTQSWQQLPTLARQESFDKLASVLGEASLVVAKVGAGRSLFHLAPNVLEEGQLRSQSMPSMSYLIERLISDESTGFSDPASPIANGLALRRMSTAPVQALNELG
eukprot:TRINITY_DN32993_c0_g1_i2.p1 TRINITY_DN32993_c0_g1~~TRINITY_DN32993_c0_g1_i2.p1  ORF type:complete len:237 (-),score=24.97 TRINITY_DN32993_c0_g1_i2:86-796(-)